MNKILIALSFCFLAGGALAAKKTYKFCATTEMYGIWIVTVKFHGFDQGQEAARFMALSRIRKLTGPEAVSINPYDRTTCKCRYGLNCENRITIALSPPEKFAGHILETISSGNPEAVVGLVPEAADQIQAYGEKAVINVKHLYSSQDARDFMKNVYENVLTGGKDVTSAIASSTELVTNAIDKTEVITGPIAEGAETVIEKVPREAARVIDQGAAELKRAGEKLKGLGRKFGL